MAVGRTALTDKLFVLGIDGLDPRLTRKYVDEGKMPNMKYLIEQGAAREDLVLLGKTGTDTLSKSNKDYVII
jgi:predicted AlkP superfamily pyrophosphatase or phosphodiesterase